MRIIAGQWRGRRLLSPGRALRPTQDKVRQILFDIVGERVAGRLVLDLYAGTGALGLEALSRGAAGAVFVEASRRTAEVLERNCRALNAVDSCRILIMRVDRALPLLVREGRSFGWILADPPYDDPGSGMLLERLGGPCRGLLDPDGGVILESRASTDLPAVSGCLRLLRERAVGETLLRFYERVEEGGGS